MAIEEENEKIRIAFSQTKVRCLDCDCIGFLRLKGKKVYLLPEEVLTTRSIRTQEYDIRKLKKKKTWKKKITAKMSLAKHGSATDPQLYSYLSLGTLFWGTIILLANVASLEKSRGVTTFLTSTCNRNYKECVKIAEMDICGHLMKQCQETKEFVIPEPVSKIKKANATSLVFTEEENEVNLRRCQKKQFYDQNICRHLCSTTLVLESRRTHPISPCESLCFELTRSSDSAGEVCPTQKYCQNGCPCPFYKCEKFDSRQKMIPVFDLNMSSVDQISDAVDTEANGDVALITGRWDARKDEKILFRRFILSNLNGDDIQINIPDSFFPYSTGATFLNGEHYFVDALGNLIRLKENNNKTILIGNGHKNIGFFVFHYGSSIGTHFIEIRLKENDTKIFPVVTICSPTGRSDKCYYYAPDYNLDRFEEAQGYIASNHFNAKVSSTSFKGVFYLMSVRMGELYIKLSTTIALNRIRREEELDRGWRKNEIQLPAELRDLDPVHVVPLNDMGRLLLILVSRSIVLSNTLYSLLLEADGKFLTLGHEWIGSLVEYEQRSICYSKLFASDDHYYTDQAGLNNDECEYFGNGIINDERILFQNYVFDILFEIEFYFEQIEVKFVQQRVRQKKVHVTSNPFFAFHDDVFPAFSKNAVSQPRFSRTSAYDKMIVPDNFFTSLEELKHISTVEMKLNGTDQFQLEINITATSNKEVEILEFNFFDGTNLFLFGLCENGSFWLKSDYFDKRFIFQSNRSEFTILAFKFNSTNSSDQSHFEVLENGGRTINPDSKIKIYGLENVQNRKVRISKLDRATKIKNFAFGQDKMINVILPHTSRNHNPYALLQDVSRITNVLLDSPIHSRFSISLYVSCSSHALVKNRLHIFGGTFDGNVRGRNAGLRCHRIETGLLRHPVPYLCSCE